MVKYVNSLDELLQSGPSESQIFEGLDEIIPSSVLYSLVASTPIEPQPQPEPQPQLPIQAVEQPVFPEAGPSQRKPAKNKRYSHVQIRALEDFIAAHPTPTYDQKFLLSQQIGLPMKKVNKWILKHKAPVIQSDEQLIAELISRNEELVKEIEELKAQNQILINALQAGNCPQCGGPVPPPGVQQQPRVDVNPPQQEILEVSSEESIDQELLWRDALESMPSGNLPGPAHDLVGVPAEEVSGIVRRAKDEFHFHGYCGYPLWILSSTDSNAYHPETLNYLEYLRMSQRGGVAPYFPV
ncbi:hypothetical protein M0R45_019402 [Rubus argutus]|uniref:Homeobox domain-containing protein n=1 Tax=Rubus argutus TaxID=59490 RepID=A0AAW1X789_RUBAR